MTLWTGIDPGKKGALSCINDRSEIVGKWKMPLVGREIDGGRLWDIFQEIRFMAMEQGGDYAIGIEKPFTMPSDVTELTGNIQEIRNAFEENDPTFDFDIALTKLEMAARRKDGRVGVLTYGKGFGLILGQISVLRTRFLEVAPRTWQAEMWRGLDRKQKPKEKSYLAATRLWPGQTFVWEGCRTFDDGLVDSLLIAEYCRRKMSGG